MPNETLTARSPFDPRHLVDDLLAGLVTFLVALPLCLGIAQASGVQPVAGILTGIVAGLVVGWFSGAQLMVSGPAAGFIAVVAIQIEALGSFEAVLVATILAGLMQVGMGLAQGGFFKAFVPTSVVRGLLSAIGVILILKQIPHLFGYDKDYEGEMSFFQAADKENTFTELVHFVSSCHLGASVLGLVCFVIYMIWSRWSVARRSGFPAALVVVVVGVGAHLVIESLATTGHLGSEWVIGSTHRVQVPVASSMRALVDGIPKPDFATLMSPAVYAAALMIAVVGSLQALLTSEAIDRLDRHRRTTPANRELIAQGIGNCVSGLLGGLPLTGEIVRSSVNIDAGAATKRAGIVHGILLAVAIMVFPWAINLIPLSCLAAILIPTGLRLASLAVVQEMWKAGRYQFIPYAATLVGIVLTDPLQGIVIGLIVSAGFILWSNLRRPMKLFVEHHLAGDVTRVELANQVSFLNRAALRRTLDSIPRGKHVLIDAHDTVYIDPDILDLIREYRDAIGPARGIKVSTRGFRDKYGISDQIQFVDFATRELQQGVTPGQALEYLLKGNARFSNGLQTKRDYERQVNATAHGQHPIAVILHCIDSRSPAELLFDLGLGDIFSIRVAGNISTEEVLGSLEFATAVAGAKLVVVLGHTRCGAVGAAVHAACYPDDPVAPDCTHLTSIVDAIARVVDTNHCALPADAPANRKQGVADEVSRRNVAQVVQDIRGGSQVIERLVGESRVGIIGMIYDVAAGEVKVVPGTAAGLPEAIVEKAIHKGIAAFA
jgi:carbonic anhydrase/SulP family sulfate permease